MSHGDGPTDDGSLSSDLPAQDPGDPPPYRPSGIDPSVESMWLRRPPPRPPGRHRLPRASTLLLVAAFIALLVLYFVVQPGH